MQRRAIQDLYDGRYAEAYDERFLSGEDWTKQGSDFELELIGELVARPGSRWLDVACGTGYYLGRFPDLERAGLDLSPGMLATAGRAAPTATLVEGSYLDDHPDWVDRWTLVSCMWAAYSYAGSLEAVEQLVANLARWTAPEGSAFLPVMDVADLSGGIDIPYRNDDTWVFGGTLLVKAAIWDWHDEKLGKHHRDLIAPHTDHLVELFGRHFRQVEVVLYPPYLPGWDSRKAIVASGKRATGDRTPTVVARREAPPCRTVVPEAPATEPETPEPAAAPPGTDDGPVTEPAAAGTVEPAGPPPDAGAPTAPTALLLRARPWRRSWWSSVSRRLRARLLRALRGLEHRLET